MTRIWYHIWCERCGRDDYIGLDGSKESGHLATINTCRCGESSLFGGFHEDRLGEGHVIFREEEVARWERLSSHTPRYVRPGTTSPTLWSRGSGV